MAPRQFSSISAITARYAGVLRSFRGDSEVDSCLSATAYCAGKTRVCGVWSVLKRPDIACVSIQLHRRRGRVDGGAWVVLVPTVEGPCRTIYGTARTVGVKRGWNPRTDDGPALFRLALVYAKVPQLERRPLVMPQEDVA